MDIKSRIKRPPLLKYLNKALPKLAELLKDEERWSSLNIDSAYPEVERLWTQWGPYRINLDKIRPCDPTLVDYHPHPWPCAVKVLSGYYEHGFGFELNPKEFIHVARTVVSPGSKYEIIHHDVWHYLKPTSEAYAVMLTGEPYKTAISKPKKLESLEEDQVKELLHNYKLLLEIPYNTK